METLDLFIPNRKERSSETKRKILHYLYTDCDYQLGNVWRASGTDGEEPQR